MKTNRITHTYYIRAPVASVFSALTEPEKLTKWFLSKAKIDAKKGGSYSFTWMGGYRQDGKVIELAKNKRLAINWAAAKGTKVVFTTLKSGNMTVLKLIHSGFPNDAIWEYGACNSGWAYYLMNLKSVLEYKRDLRHKKDSLFG